MAETVFLAAVAEYLKTGVALAPAPATIGIADPVAVNELPAIGLSLEAVRRLGSGLGERAALITDGALPWRATIDLANPVLPDEPGFSLLSADRRQLVLPHGGLRQADGGDGPLGASDLKVTVAGAARTLVAGPPGANEYRVDPLVGTLTFGAPLPAAGNVVADYVLGQWERRTVEIEGVLRLTVWAGVASAAGDLSSAAVDALMAAPQVGLKGLRKIAVTELGTVTAPDTLHADARARSARFTFQYTHEINRPDSSGGIIQRVPITSRTAAITVDRATGTLQTTLISETS